MKNNKMIYKAQLISKLVLKIGSNSKTKDFLNRLKYLISLNLARVMIKMNLKHQNK